MGISPLDICSGVVRQVWDEEFSTSLSNIKLLSQIGCESKPLRLIHLSGQKEKKAESRLSLFLETFLTCSSRSVLPDRHRHAFLKFVLVQSCLNVLKRWKTKKELKKRKLRQRDGMKKKHHITVGFFKRTVKRYALCTFHAWTGKMFGSAFPTLLKWCTVGEKKKMIQCL